MPSAIDTHVPDIWMHKGHARTAQIIRAGIPALSDVAELS